MTRPTSRRRLGFTLVELLVVIVVIGILIALLVPVIAGAIRTANDAAVISEITTLTNALASFKERYGEYPPSRIILMENGFYDTSSANSLNNPPAGAWFSSTTLANNPPINDMNPGASPVAGAARYSANDLTYGQLAARSVRFLRKFFPKATFNTNPAAGAIYPSTALAPIIGFHDFNGNTTLDTTPILLEGHECLVFFLGGIPNQAGSVLGMDGFAKLPANPFISSNLPATVPPVSRYSPLFEFKGDRLIDDDGDGMPGYVDNLGRLTDARYYAYFSAYTQNGYDPNDVNFAEPDDVNGTTTAIYRAFRVSFGVGSPPSTSLGSFAPNPYTTSDAFPVGAPAFSNPITFQIISAGRDRHYGIGGQYAPNAANDRLPFPDPPQGSIPSGAPGWPAETLETGLRIRTERDNLSNFAPAKLD